MNRWTLAASVSFVCSTAWCEAWRTTDGEVAHTVGVVASDGAAATLEVRCRPRIDIKLTHPALAGMPTDDTGVLDWDQRAIIHDGWGLDLTRPDHYGHLGRWSRCAHRPDCVRAEAYSPESMLRNLRRQWSWFIRIQPPDAEHVDVRISLVGAAKAFDAVCPRPPGNSDRDGVRSHEQSSTNDRSSSRGEVREDPAVP